MRQDGVDPALLAHKFQKMSDMSATKIEITIKQMDKLPAFRAGRHKLCTRQAESFYHFPDRPGVKDEERRHYLPGKIFYFKQQPGGKQPVSPDRTKNIVNRQLIITQHTTAYFQQGVGQLQIVRRFFFFAVHKQNSANILRLVPAAVTLLIEPGTAGAFPYNKARPVALITPDTKCPVSVLQMPHNYQFIKDSFQYPSKSRKNMTIFPA
jgi:hypothetical protein